LPSNFGSLIGWLVAFVVVYGFFQTRTLNNYEDEPMSRNTSVHQLEKSISNHLRTSQSFSFRDNPEASQRRRSTNSRRSTDVRDPREYGNDNYDSARDQYVDRDTDSDERPLERGSGHRAPRL